MPWWKVYDLWLVKKLTYLNVIRNGLIFSYWNLFLSITWNIFLVVVRYSISIWLCLTFISYPFLSRFLSQCYLLILKSKSPISPVNKYFWNIVIIFHLPLHFLFTLFLISQIIYRFDTRIVQNFKYFWSSLLNQFPFLFWFLFNSFL